MKPRVILLSIFAISMFNMTFSQPIPSLRTIFWVHGFGGDQTTWQKYCSFGSPFAAPNYFPADLYRFSYTTMSGIAYAATDASNQMAFQGQTNDDFAICHSMGGLTIRKVEIIDDPIVGIDGYITVGTPNDGAYLAQSFLDGDVDQFFLNFCNEVVADPASVATSYWLNYLNYIIANNTYVFENNGFDICGSLYQKIKDGPLNSLTSQTTVVDLAPNSQAINELKSYNSQLPRIAIYGNENRPVHWRLFQSFIFPPSGLPINNVYDQLIPSLMNYMRFEYYHFAAICNTFFVATLPAPLILTPAFDLEYVPFLDLAIQLREAGHWLGQSEDYWGSLICETLPPGPLPQLDDWQSYIYHGPGSSQNQIQNYQEVDDNTLISQVFLQESILNCTLNNPEWWPYDLHEVTQFGICESDGVVTRNSAGILPNSSAVNFIEIRNANHQQLVIPISI